MELDSLIKLSVLKGSWWS